MWDKMLAQWRQILELQNTEVFFYQKWVLIILALALLAVFKRRWLLSLVIVAAIFVLQVIITMASTLGWNPVTAYNSLIIGIVSVILIITLLHELFSSERS